MRMKRYIQLFAGLLLGVMVSACDVHEFPEHDYLEFELNLTYDTEMPLYMVDETSLKTRAEVASDYRLRYIIEVYRTNQDGRFDDNSPADMRIVKYENDINNLNQSFILQLKPGYFTFVVWTDYIKANTTTDLYYKTDDLGEIQTIGRPHVGANDFRDGFYGKVASHCGYENLTATVELHRPFAKFNFISTDLEEFYTRVIQMRIDRNLLPEKPSGSDEDTRANINLDDFTVRFIYEGNIPYSFNAERDNGFPNDVALTQIYFDSKIKRINEDEVELGFDYVMAYTDKDTDVKVGLEVTDFDKTVVSSVNPVPVKLMQSMLTTKKGEFLTSKAVGGVGIRPGFNEDPDGEFNYPVDD